MRILILGAAGMLGHKIHQRLAQRFPDTWAAVRKHKNFYKELGIFKPELMIDEWDLSIQDSLIKNLDACRPDVIVNCAGITTRKLQSSSAIPLILINSLLPHNLSQWCHRSKARLIHFSTDCVFSGNQGPYDETSLKDASDPYGQSKSLGEVDEVCALTIRSSIIGFELGTATELLGWILSQRGKRIKGFTKALYSGVTTNWMAECVEEIITDHPKLYGVMQVASEPISKADLLTMVNSAFQLDCEIEPSDSVITDKRLNGTRFQNDTGIVVPSWQNLIEQLVLDYPNYEKFKGRVVA